MADSEHVPSHGGKNWVTKTGGLPEYINRIAKDLMDKGMSESHAIASAVNTVKRWARGGGKVTPKTRAKAAAALAEWESKKAASHVGLSTPTRLDRTRHARLQTMDLAAVLDRTAQIADPVARERVTAEILDLADAETVQTPSYNVDKVREAWQAQETKKRQARDEFRRQTAQAGGATESIPYSPYRHVSEVWNTHLIVKGDGGTIHKVPYSVHPNGVDVKFGPEKKVTQQYVELSAATEDGLLAVIDETGRVIDLAGVVPQFGQANSSGAATTPAALATANAARNAKAARKQAAGSRKTKRKARKSKVALKSKAANRLHATQVRVGAKMAAMKDAEAHPEHAHSKAIRDAVKVHQAQERTQARTEATGSGTGGAKWAHGWVPLNDAAKKQVAANPEKFKQMRKQQKKQGKAPRTVALSAALDRAAQIEDPEARAAARLAVLDLAKPGQRYRHGWIRIDGVPVGKSRPKVAGSRGRLVDGLTKEEHSARVDRLAAIPRTERTQKQQDQFVRSNAVLRGEAVPARSSAPVGEAAKASQAATSAGIEARKARKGLPAGQTPGSNGGMTNDPGATHVLNGDIEHNGKLLESQHLAPSLRRKLERKQDDLHTTRGQALWPGLSAEQARYRSVQDHQLRTGATSLGPNAKAPDWYTGPEPKRVKQGSGGFEVTAPRSEDPIGDAMRNAPRGRPARPPLSRRQTLAELNTKARKAARKNAPDPVEEAMRNTPRRPASAPISAQQAKAELDARDVKASDRLIAEMPTMDEHHLTLALNSPGTSQKVKDAAREHLSDRAIRRGGDRPDKPWSEIPADYKTTRNGQRWVMAMGPNGTELRPYRDPAKKAERLPSASPSDAMSARTVSSTTTSGATPMDRGTFKALGFKHGDPVEIAGPRGNNHIGTATVRSGEIGVLKEDGKVHSLGGVATKVVGRKVDHSKIPPMSTPAHPDAYGVQSFEVPGYQGKGTITRYRALGRDGKPIGNGSYYGTEASAKAVAEMHRPPAHREPGAVSPGQAARAAELRKGSTGRHPIADAPSTTPPPAREAVGAHPEKFKPGEKPAVHKFMNSERLQQIANGDHPEHAAKAKEILQKRNKTTGITRGAAPAGYDPSGQGVTAKALKDEPASSVAAMIAAVPQTSTDHRLLKADRSNAVAFAKNESKSGLLDTLKSYDVGDGPSYKPFALAELDRRGLGHLVPAKTREHVEAGRILGPNGWRGKGEVRGTQSTNDAARGMTERILASRAAKTPQVMNPRTPTGTSVIKHPTKGGLWLHGPDGEYPIPAEAQKSTEALQKWADENLHRVDAEGARGRALQAGARMPASPPGGNASADITAARRARGQIDTPGRPGKSGLPTLATPTHPTDKRNVLNHIVSNKSALEVGGVVVDMNSANIAKNVIDALSPENRAKLLALPFQQMVERAMALYARTQKR